jgi:hypothetical protein
VLRRGILALAKAARAALPARRSYRPEAHPRSGL